LIGGDLLVVPASRKIIGMIRPLAVTVLLAFLPIVWADEPKPTDEKVAPVEKYKADQRSHWAFQPLERPVPPDVKEVGWVKNPIDRFVLADLESVSFKHAPEADRIALIRRVTFDLTGLPPTPIEVEGFLDDTRPDAYERVVDRLLESPRFGERWAQHWLDLAHYADSNGFELDAERPDAWRYRDWVVKAFNDDMPYDRFLGLQLAGDEIEPGSVDALVATGFGRCGPREVVAGNIDPAVRRQSELTEITGTVGSVFLGLTVGCARCHDHKFDPLPTTDYYRLQAFFAGAELVEKPTATKDEEEAYKTRVAEIDKQIAPFRKQMADLEAPYRKTLLERKRAALTESERAVLAIPEKDRTDIQKKMVAGAQKALNITWEEVAESVSADAAPHVEREKLKRAIHELDILKPPPPAKAMALVEKTPTAPDSFVLRRGEPQNKGVKVVPRPPGVLLACQGVEAFPQTIAPTESSSGRRAALAAWLARRDNPLTARVIVNRLWQHHFGRGLVSTSSDFGARGELPTNPPLLDWLAGELLNHNWKLKPLHRLMVTSAAYRQSSRFSHPQQVADDPENQLLSRMNRRRLEAESLRDALLAVSGEIQFKMGGPGVLVPIEKEIRDLIFTEAEVVDLWPETRDPLERSRRSLYVFRKRNVRYPMFDAFDAPDTQTACPTRSASTHALQSLVMLNSDFTTGRAKALAGRLYRESTGTSARVTRAYRIVLARDPRPQEREQALEFIASQTQRLQQRARTSEPLASPAPAPTGADPAEAAAWVDFTLAMLNRNEFLYIP
jgi:Protein of unknown function (DUF1553)/Protein of unknown function (DUF1549)